MNHEPRQLYSFAGFELDAAGRRRLAPSVPVPANLKENKIYRPEDGGNLYYIGTRLCTKNNFSHEFSRIFTNIFKFFVLIRVNSWLILKNRFIFVQSLGTQGNTGNVWTLSIADAGIKPVTNLKNSSLTDFAFSADRKRLALALSERLSDVVLITEVK